MKRVDPELKSLALGLAKSGALSPATIARELALNPQTLAYWISDARIDVKDEQARFARNYVEYYRGLINGGSKP